MAKRVKRLPTEGQDIKLQIVLNAEDDSDIIEHFRNMMVDSQTRNASGEIMYVPMGTLVHNAIKLYMEQQIDNGISPESAVPDAKDAAIAQLQREMAYLKTQFDSQRQAAGVKVDDPAQELLESGDIDNDEDDGDWVPNVKI